MLNQTTLKRGLGALFTAAISVRVTLPLSEITVAISVSRTAAGTLPAGDPESTTKNIDS